MARIDADPAEAARLRAVALPPGQALDEALGQAWEAGDALAPLDPDLGEAATARLLARLRPATFRDRGGTRALPDPRALPAGTGLVVVTSGATGRPKAVVLARAALDAAVRASLARLGARPDDRWLCCLPTHHVAGLAVLLRARALGTAPVVHPRFDPAAVAAETDVTHVALVPTQLRRLLEAGVDLARFRAVLLGGAAPGRGLVAAARAAGARLVESYGMTETCGGCVYDGRPLDGVDVAIGADGRIRLRGPVLFEGYLDEPEATAAACEDGWLVTGDLGRLAEGRLEVAGRADDVIVTGGENVAAAAVAEALAEHPAVAEAFVAGRPDPEWGEAVVAWLVPARSAPAADGQRAAPAEQGPDEAVPAPGPDEAVPVAAGLAAALRAAVAARLGRAAAPKALAWVDRLPRGGLGKVARDALPPMRDDGGERTGGAPSAEVPPRAAGPGTDAGGRDE
ncbi:MAG: AMP-binding protein [Egibacteraceae bacterium]